MRRAGAAGLIALAMAATTGCAYGPKAEMLAFGSSWKRFASQAAAAQPGDTRFGSAGPTGPTAPDPEAARQFDAVPQARKAVERVQKVLQAKSPSRDEVQRALGDLEEAEGLVGRQARHDPVLLARLRAKIQDLRRHVEARLLEILKIEPSVNIEKRGAVRLAVVKIGEGVETIRLEEQRRWRKFLAGAGFTADTVFISSPLAGAAPSAADLRVAAARLRADAVLAYTTTAAVTEGSLGASVAVLAFAKCMLVDTRTEYLYLNAEGENRLRRIGLPFTVSPRTAELECIGNAVGALRTEFGDELKRLVQAGRAGGG